MSSNKKGSNYQSTSDVCDESRKTIHDQTFTYQVGFPKQRVFSKQKNAAAQGEFIKNVLKHNKSHKNISCSAKVLSSRYNKYCKKCVLVSAVQCKSMFSITKIKSCAQAISRGESLQKY